MPDPDLRDVSQAFRSLWSHIESLILRERTEPSKPSEPDKPTKPTVLVLKDTWTIVRRSTSPWRSADPTEDWEVKRKIETNFDEETKRAPTTTQGGFVILTENWSSVHAHLPSAKEVISKGEDEVRVKEMFRDVIKEETRAYRWGTRLVGLVANRSRWTIDLEVDFSVEADDSHESEITVGQATGRK